MTRTICDKCGKILAEDHSNVANLGWNFYGVSGFKPQKQEYNFCVDCAKEIEKLLLSKMAKIEITVTTSTSTKDSAMSKEIGKWNFLK